MAPPSVLGQGRDDAHDCGEKAERYYIYSRDGEVSSVAAWKASSIISSDDDLKPDGGARQKTGDTEKKPRRNDIITEKTYRCSVTMVAVVVVVVVMVMMIMIKYV